MKETKAPPTTPSPGPSSVFITMALDMSWRLAVAVIIPIVGSYYLDQHFDTSPWLTIGGFLVAGGGVAGVLRRMLSEASKASETSLPKAGKRS